HMVARIQGAPAPALAQQDVGAGGFDVPLHLVALFIQGRELEPGMRVLPVPLLYRALHLNLLITIVGGTAMVGLHQARAEGATGKQKQEFLDHVSPRQWLSLASSQGKGISYTVGSISKTTVGGPS